MVVAVEGEGVEPFADGGRGRRGRSVVEVEGADTSYQTVETNAAHKHASVLISVWIAGIVFISLVW